MVWMRHGVYELGVKSTPGNSFFPNRFFQQIYACLASRATKQSESDGQPTELRRKATADTDRGWVAKIETLPTEGGDELTRYNNRFGS